MEGKWKKGSLFYNNNNNYESYVTSD